MDPTPKPEPLDLTEINSPFLTEIREARAKEIFYTDDLQFLNNLQSYAKQEKQKEENRNGTL